MSVPPIIHVPDDFDEDRTAGTFCGLIFGDEGWDSDRDAVITDPNEARDVTCIKCFLEAPVGDTLIDTP